MKLSDNIKSIRKENNLSQEQLAEQLGVSRQAVSKWESGQSYPEMDKVLLICKMFNYNIDELMNEDIKEVSDTKQSKININKYIDDFFNFITKTVDMLGVMKFRQKMKCFIEQIFIATILFLIFFILGTIGSSILMRIFETISYNFYCIIRNILESIYIILALIVGMTIMLHIFKIRYLDYYEIVKTNDLNESDSVSNEESNNNEEKKKFFIEKNKEKIIIRDPEHSQSKFLTGIIKFVLFCIKGFAIWLGLCVAFSFIGLLALLVLSFLFVRTGIVFMGVFLGILSAILINFLILQIIYNFLVNKKNHKTRIWIVLISSLILMGISIGMVLVGTTNFNATDEINVNNQIEDVYNIEMTDKLSINNYWNNNIEYIETDSNEIKVIVKHSKYYKTDFINRNDMIYISTYQDNTKFMESIRYIIDNINNKVIVSVDNYSFVEVHTSKENIDKLKQNSKIREENERNREDEILKWYNENEKLENTIINLEKDILKLNEQMKEKELIIENQEQEIKEKNNEILILQQEN